MLQLYVDPRHYLYLMTAQILLSLPLVLTFLPAATEAWGRPPEVCDPQLHLQASELIKAMPQAIKWLAATWKKRLVLPVIKRCFMPYHSTEAEKLTGYKSSFVELRVQSTHLLLQYHLNCHIKPNMELSLWVALFIKMSNWGIKSFKSVLWWCRWMTDWKTNFITLLINWLTVLLTTWQPDWQADLLIDWLTAW